jgi:hypothetical protein
MKTFTVFVRDLSEVGGTTWIDTVRAVTVEDAKRKAVRACAEAWGYLDDPETVHLVEELTCIGVAKGNVQILDWQD